ncbi:MAG: sulfate transporter CysZ [Chromatiales bacterium]|jgi:CysZ protein
MLKESNNPVIGFNYVVRGLELIRVSGLRRFVLIPLVINILIFSLMLWFGIDAFGGFMDDYLPEGTPPSWLPEWGWLQATFTFIVEPFRWLLWILFALAFLLILIYGFTIVANIIGAPFNDLLSAKVEEHLTGKKPDEAQESILAAIWPSIVSELQKAGYFLTRGIPLLILFLIPGINIIAPIVWGLYSAWVLANEYAEYPMGLHGIRFKEQRRFLKNRRLSTYGFGGGVMLMTVVPVLNFIAMPTAVAGATAWWVERLGPAMEDQQCNKL